MKTSAACSCDLAGWCARHKRQKTDLLLDYCRTNFNGYRDHWDALANPAAPRPKKVREAAAPANGRCNGCGSEAMPVTLLQQGFHFASAVTHWLANGAITTTEAQYAERKRVCESCEHLTCTLGLKKCGRCKCFIGLKAGLIEKNDQSDCPAGKWAPLERVEHAANALDLSGMLLTSPLEGRPVRPFGGPTVRHLLFHLMPTPLVWPLHLEQLSMRIDLFNGCRVCAIVTGENLVEPRVIRDAFGDIFDEYIVMPNVAKLREVQTFESLFSRVASTAENEIVFYAHGKGATKPVNPGVTVHRWAEIMYETCLDHMPLAELMLERYPCAGSFLRPTKMGSSHWHYSGTFFWMRSARLFAQNWRKIQRKWWGVEAWPGLQFALQDAGVLFALHRGLELYQMDRLKAVEEKYDEWKIMQAAAV